MLDNRRAELSHTLTKPSWYTASVKRKIGGAGALHASILIANCHQENQNFRCRCLSAWWLGTATLQSIRSTWLKSPRRRWVDPLRFSRTGTRMNALDQIFGWLMIAFGVAQSVTNFRIQSASHLTLSLSGTAASMIVSGFLNVSRARHSDGLTRAFSVIGTC